ncbi:MAG TPA: putative lipid II flippase FtsW [Acidimicrobiales bacterium]|nr:putative lipid II flippase FtsW [Acidimicrobiales bacterium]
MNPASRPGRRAAPEPPGGRRLRVLPEGPAPKTLKGLAPKVLTRAAGKPGEKKTVEQKATPATTTRVRPAAHAHTSIEFRVLFLSVAGLSLIGLPMVLSASSVLSVLSGSTPYSIFERQCIFLLAAVVVGAIAYFWVPTSRLRRLRFVMPYGVMALLVIVFLPGVGHYAGGSSRWIGVGPIQIQPSELMKISVVVFAADLLARRAHRTDYWAAIVRPLLILLAASAGLILAQPDLGTTIVIGCITFVMMFSAGIPMGLLSATVAVLAFPGGYYALHAAYRRDRFLSFLNPFAHASGTGYQIVQSLSTLGMGGLGGNGVGASPATWGFLPNAHTDFVFAVIGGNLGLIGSIAVIGLFGLFAWAGFRIAAREPDPFSRYVAVGITCWIVCQAVINVGGVIDALPITGIPLPFISYGGSALVAEMAGAGLLLGIARRQHAAAR